MAVPFIVAGLCVALAGAGIKVASHIFRSRGIEDSPYDVVVNIDALSTISTTGWEITIKPPPRKDQTYLDGIKALVMNAAGQRGVPSGLADGGDVQVRELAHPDVIPVGVIGLFDRGKTWFINYLFETNFPSGDMVHPAGLSLICPRARRPSGTLSMDTAGSDTPTPDDSYLERKTTEAFLRELVIELSSAIFVVVNCLRLNDQAYIRGVVEFAKKRNPGVRIFIIHNLSMVRSKEDVETIIATEIIQCCHAKEHMVSLDANHTSRFFQSTICGVLVEHFIFAQEKSIAAGSWNASSRDAIRHRLQATAVRKTFDLVPSIIKIGNRRLPELLSGREQMCLKSAVVNGKYVIMEDEADALRAGATSLESSTLSDFPFPAATSRPPHPLPDVRLNLIGNPSPLPDGEGGEQDTGTPIRLRGERQANRPAVEVRREMTAAYDGSLLRSGRPKEPGEWEPEFTLHTYKTYYHLFVNVCVDGDDIEVSHSVVNQGAEGMIRDPDTRELQTIIIRSRRPRILMTGEPLCIRDTIPTGHFSLTVVIPTRIETEPLPEAIVHHGLLSMRLVRL